MCVCACVCLGRQSPIKAWSRGAAVKYCWELHHEGPASGTLKYNRGCKTQNSHTYVQCMTQSLLNDSTSATLVPTVRTKMFLRSVMIFLFSNTNSPPPKTNYKNFNKTLKKRIHFSSVFATPKLTKPFHCTQSQEVWWNLPCSVSKTRSPDAHSVWAERRAHWAPAKNTPVCSVRVGLGANLGPGL